LFSFIAALAAALVGSDSLPPVHHGTRGQLEVEPPRIEESAIRIDGVLDEAEWGRAAVLKSFTQLEPVEGASASERTDVLVFYTPEALYFGVRARARETSSIRASLAERDRIGSDDHILFLLDTYLDRQRAFSFAVNPRGVQQDGIFTESPGRRISEQVDLAPDFHFESAGNLTPEGYTLEIRIPFSSLKFPASQPLRWGLHVVRHIPATGAWESWAPLSRDRAHTLAQGGILVGLQGLERGRLVEVNPVATGKRESGGQLATGGRGFEPELGLNLKLGLSSAVTLDATLNPDFSQIEADVGQITVNERFAIQYPEKRPFFLEGAELFSTPETLVHTRTIANPYGGLKLTGTAGGLSFGALGTLDESGRDERGASARVGIARVRRNLPGGASVGILATERSSEDVYNRVAAVDGEARFGGLYTATGQAAGSWTGDADGGRSALLLRAALDRTGRYWGFLYQLRDVPADFRSRTGYIRRVGISEGLAANRFTYYPAPGGAVESVTTRVSVNRIFAGRDLWTLSDPLEGTLNARVTLAIRGNQRLTAGLGRRFFNLDPAAYAGYRVLGADGTETTADRVIDPRISGLPSLSLEASSSALRTLTLAAEARREETPIFAEGSRGVEWSGGGSARLQPSPGIRLEGGLRASIIDRLEDGSRYSTALLPRIRAEYQITRAAFLRVVAQYTLEEVDLLRGPEGTPFRTSDGSTLRIRRGERILEGDSQPNPLRADLLFGYQPSPGTVLYLGYGREVEDPQGLRPTEPRWQGLFVKLSYLLRP
jgi:hypothetical protein